MASTVFPAASSGVTRRTAVFTSSGTFTLPSGYDSNNPLICEVYIQGAGAGGGSGAFNSTQGNGGGGGGAGYCMYLPNLSLTANATVTIGTGGAGGASQTSAPNLGIVGTAGGNTSFAGYTAPGGGRGGSGGTSGGDGSNGGDMTIGTSAIVYGGSCDYSGAPNSLPRGGDVEDQDGARSSLGRQHHLYLIESSHE